MPLIEMQDSINKSVKVDIVVDAVVVADVVVVVVSATRQPPLELKNELGIE